MMARRQERSCRVILCDSPSPTSGPLGFWQCLTQPPYCGRGPLQITSYSNYDFCSSDPVCDCPDIADDIESVSSSPQIGFGTAACVWGSLFGHSLTDMADGTRAQSSPHRTQP